MDTERHNQQQIQQLNQRGGPSMSVVGLIQAGTLTPDAATLCWMEITRGTSFMTGAVPGGAGKTTVMAALMAFLPPDETITTVADRRTLDRALVGALPRPATLLAHEIGAGRWFGYIWGKDAADFFRMTGRDTRCVTCLHADDPGQAFGILSEQGVDSEDFDRVGLQLYLHRGLRHGRILRRIAGLYCHLDDGLVQIERWQAAGDRHQELIPRSDVCAQLASRHGTATTELAEEWNARQAYIERLVKHDVFAYEDFREAVLNYPG
jgi:hypothetical protein